MSGNTYGVSEIVGTSEQSLTDAINNGISRASRTVRNLDWFEVTGVRGYIRDNEVNHFQVQMKVGFRIEEAG
jgi:flavin-binding protein dodecin